MVARLFEPGTSSSFHLHLDVVMTLPKVLHTADFHINALKRFNGYLSRMEQTLSYIHSKAKKEKCDLIVVAGDVWHSKSITHEERQLFSDWLGSSRLPTVVISGNHDKRSTTPGDSSLSYLSSLNSIMSRHLVWDGLPTVKLFHDCVFLLYPGFDWSHQEFDLMIQAMLPTAEKLSRNKYPIVCVAHELVNGSKADTGFPLKGARITLRPTRYPQIAYWALGDVHIAQRIAPKAFYCGAPHQTKFDERPGKGVLVVNLSKADSPKLAKIPSISLLQVTKLPNPIPTDAYIQYKPTKLEAKTDLPPNVTYHPSAAMFAEFKSSRVMKAGLFDHLDEFLKQIGQKRKDRKFTWKLVKKLGDRLDIEVSIPSKYIKGSSR